MFFHFRLDPVPKQLLITDQNLQHNIKLLKGLNFKKLDLRIFYWQLDCTNYRYILIAILMVSFCPLPCPRCRVASVQPAPWPPPEPGSLASLGPPQSPPRRCLLPPHLLPLPPLPLPHSHRYRFHLRSRRRPPPPRRLRTC